jgi:Integrase core domain
MGTDVARYVRNCASCRRGKNLRHAAPGLLQPMPVPDGRWEEVSIDFVTGVPVSSGYNAVMCAVDRLTKRRRLIPCTDEIDARGAAELYIKHIYCQYGLSLFITTDRGTQFTAELWRQICRRLGIKQRLSTAYHPETDGQTENANAVFEQYLRMYVNYLQDDWSDWLSLAEFTANNWTSESTKCSPFYADIGRHPRTGYEPPRPTVNTSVRVRRETEAADALVQRLQKIEEQLKSNMTWAQSQQEKNANRHRTPQPAYQIGDMVYLSSKNIRTERPSHKLDWKHLGPFPILEKISATAYKIKLPNTMKIWPVFHTSLLQPAATDLMPGQKPTEPPLIVIKDKEEYKVRQIVDSRYNKRSKRWEYKV